MKLAQLKAVGHNIADSMAAEIGLMIGYYPVKLFEECGRGHIDLNLLDGSVSGAAISRHLGRYFELYRKVLPEFCAKHKVRLDQFAVLSVRFRNTSYGNSFIVTVGDQTGRRSTVEYVGSPGRRVKALDHLGRVRPKKLIR